MVGEWAWPKDAEETKLPPSANNILAYVIQRLRKIAHPPVVESSSSTFPPFRIKACVLGKFCSGKTTCLAKISEGKKIWSLKKKIVTLQMFNTFLFCFAEAVEID